MDYSEYDKVRRSAVPLQLDVVEAFAAGRLSRREFIQRATVLGLSMSAIGIVIAACSGDAVVGRPERGREHGRQRRRQRRSVGSAAVRPASAKTGGTIRVACQRPKWPRPGRDAWTSASYGITAQSFEFLCHAEPRTPPTSRRAWP